MHSQLRDDAMGPSDGSHEFESAKYRTLARLGQGGMAEVFLSAMRGPAGFNKLVVIKKLRDTLAEDASHRDMFLDEARLAARLSHPNVVQTYEVGEHGGVFFITMEYLDGQPLSRLVREIEKRNIHPPHALLARIVSNALAGLHYAHELKDYDGTALKIVHRDVSPQNIFVTYDGMVKLVDFGIAKAELSSTKTQAGIFKGKAAYAAPEQLQSDSIDRRADVFTSGIVLWELLARQRLMAAGTTAMTLFRLMQDVIPTVSSVVPNVDPRLEAIVMRALERDPARRFQTALEMREALEDYLRTTPVVRDEDLGRLMNDLFSDVRAKIQRAIKEQMALATQQQKETSLVSATRMVLDADSPNSIFSTRERSSGRVLLNAPGMTGITGLTGMNGSSSGLMPSEVAPPSIQGTYFSQQVQMPMPARSRLMPIAFGAIAVLGIAVGAIGLAARRADSGAAARPPMTAVITEVVPHAVPVATVAAPVAAPTQEAAPPATHPAATTAPKEEAPRPSYVRHAPPPRPAAKPAAPASSPASEPAPAARPSQAVAPQTPPPAPPTATGGRKFRTEL